MSEVVLEYKRVKGVLSTGRVLSREGSDEYEEHQFEDLEFRDMLRLFAGMLSKYSDAKAVWQRTDRPGLVPYELEDRVVRMFRDDPVAAIASMCPPQQSQSPSVAAQRTRPVRMVAASVRAGHDTLADAFGDAVYARTRARLNGIMYVECPCCGIWTVIHLSISDSTIGTSICMNTRCSAFDKPLPFITQNDRWAGYPTSCLLATASPRFYLPRAWNDGRSWVSWAALNEKYTEYEKEKEAWSLATPQRA